MPWQAGVKDPPGAVYGCWLRIRIIDVLSSARVHLDGAAELRQGN
jgi:hypothetical protein